MNENIQKLKEWIQESDNVVFFGGAGVSTESGIPDFRSVDGLYNQKWDYPPETILSHSFFNRYPDEYYRFHREKLVIEGVKPNRAHNWKRKVSFVPSSHRILTVFIRLQEAKMCWSCTEVFFGHIVPGAAESILRK